MIAATVCPMCPKVHHALLINIEHKYLLLDYDVDYFNYIASYYIGQLWMKLKL